MEFVISHNICEHYSESEHLTMRKLVLLIILPAGFLGLILRPASA